MTREEAIGVLEDVRDAICESIPGSHPELDELKEAVQMAVNALAERKKGKWKKAYLDHEAMGERPSILYCSVCNQCIAYPVNYCPNCGARMER